MTIFAVDSWLDLMAEAMLVLPRVQPIPSLRLIQLKALLHVYFLSGVVSGYGRGC